MPQDTENLDILQHESALLGAIMCDHTIMDKFADNLSWNDFIGKDNRKVYYAMKSLWMANIEIDLITMVDFCKKHYAEEDRPRAYIISGLTQLVPSASNWSYYCDAIRNESKRRKILELRELDITLTPEQMLQKIDDIVNHVSINMDRSYKTMAVAGQELRIHLKAAIKHQSVPGAILSGTAGLDTLTCGFQKGDLVIIAGRPGKGKTAYSVNEVAINVAKSGTPVGIFSLEMSRIQLTMRMLSHESGVDFNRLRSGKVYESDIPKISEAFKVIEALPILIDDEAALKLPSLKVKAKAMKMVEKVGLIIIDYLQLIDTDGIIGSRNDQVAAISRNLKVLAKQLEIPVIALCQLSRESERSGTKRPNLIHLRDSGAIEQDADVVIFVHNDEDEKKKNDSPYESIVKSTLIVAKQRQGPVGDVYLDFIKNIMRFSE